MEIIKQTEIQGIKTTISPKFNGTESSLVIILKNNEEKIVDTAHENSHNSQFTLFYIDVHANRQAEIGKKIAEFLNVPYKDSEYNP